MPDPGWIETTLAELASADRFRMLRARPSGAGPHLEGRTRRLLNCSSNNYLDLAGHPAVLKAVGEALAAWGWGSGAGAHVTGWTELHAECAEAIAAFEGTEDAVLFSTGYQANLGAIGALVGPGDRVILDKRVHASIIDGARLSGARVRATAHNDTARLERLLARPASGRTLVAVDGVYSMDGDCAPLGRIVPLAEAHGAMLLVDEAHGTGVVGPEGRGASALFGVEERITLRVGTLSKALGGIGGFAAGSRALCDCLRNRARSMIYTTALPPAACAAARVALALVREEPWRREAVRARAARFRARLREGGLDAPEAESAIVPVVVGGEREALRLAEALLAEGILVPAIRPPTVPRGTSRVRFSWMATHTEEEVDRAAAATLRHAPLPVGERGGA